MSHNVNASDFARFALCFASTILGVFFPWPFRTSRLLKHSGNNVPAYI